MDRLKLVKRIAELHPQLKAKEAEHTVKVILDALSATLAKGGRIEIRGFGSFFLNRLPPKQKANSRAGFTIKEPSRYTPEFRPAKELRVRVERNAAESAEICHTQPITPDLLDRNVANDAESAVAYA